MKQRKEKRKSGFTMVELVAVLIILGLLAGVVAKNVIGNIDKARIKQTQANLKILHEAVIEYKMDTGYYPSEEEGLLALVEQPMDVDEWRPGGYLQGTEIPQDGWGNEFIFQLDPESGKPFVIISYGADGEPDGEDNDADMYSTDF